MNAICRNALNILLFICVWNISYGNRADFHDGKVLEKITFGSCNKHDKAQPLWDKVVEINPDIWIWLGDAVYADTRIFPMMWIPSSLETMKGRFDAQRNNSKYQNLLQTTSVIGVWDDHDYGNNNGGKSYLNRLQSQGIYLDFLDEPKDSVRRKREGLYVSYSYGIPGKIVKVILLDVRSHYEGGLFSKNCDMLGKEQWDWLKDQLEDASADLTIIGNGLQVLSDIPFSEKWMSCRSNLDRLIWLTQQYPRVIFLSGDVHFSEVNCYNATSTGYPLYEFTSSGLTHSCSASLLPSEVCHWTLKNVVASRYRVSKVVTNLSFGSIAIDWNTPRKIEFRLIGLEGTISEVTIPLDDLEVKKQPSSCPSPMEQPCWYWKRVFWISVILLAITIFFIVLRTIIVALRWVSMVLLKDLDTKIKHRLKKLRTQLVNMKSIKNNKHKILKND